MIKTIINKSAKNFFYFLISFFSSSLIGFIATPIIIYYVGKNDYGVYRIILEFLGYLSLCDMGLATTSNSLLSKSIRENTMNHTLGVIKSLNKAYFKIYPLIAFSIVLVYLLLTQVSNLESTTTNLATFLMIALPAFYFPLLVYRDYFVANEQAHLVSKSSLLQLVLLSVFNISFSYFGLGLFGLGLSYFLANSSFFLCLVYFSRKELKGDYGPVKSVDLGEIWSLNKHSFLQDIFGRLSFMTDNVIVSRYFSFGEVTNFFTNQRIMSLGNSFSQNFGSSSWPSIVKTYKEDGNHLDFSEVFNFFNRALVFLSAPLFFTMGLNNKEFITLWLGSDYYVSDLLTWSSVLTYFAFGLISFWGWILLGVDQMKARTRLVVISGIINIVASVLLTKHIGVEGPILGTMLSFYGFYIWAMLYVFQVKLKVKMIRFYGRLMAIFITYGAIYYFFKPYLNFIVDMTARNWFYLILQLGVHYFIFLIIASPFIIRPSDIKKLKKLIEDRYLSKIKKKLM